jgi:ABC-2 type transport system permease protein
VFDAKDLWKKRLAVYLRETAGYWKYVLKSGLATLGGLLMIVLAAYAPGLLDSLPADFPYAVPLALILAPLAAYSPVRTLLRQADLTFLLPAEFRMSGYFQGALRYTWMIQSLRLAAAFLLLWPLQLHFAKPGPGQFQITLLMLLAAKTANLAAAWRETRFSRCRQRVAAALSRGAWTAAVLYAWFAGHPAAAGVLAVTGTAFAWLILRTTPKYRIRWTGLCASEARRQARLYRFFSWFQDMPESSARPRKRPLLSKLAESIPHRRENSYLFLYAISAARTETGGMTLRLAAAGLLLECLFPAAVAQAIVFTAAVACIGLQLTSMATLHRHALWPRLYPLDPRQRAHSLVKLAACVQTVLTLILAVPLLVCHAAALWYVPLAGLVLSLARITAGWRKKLERLFQT